MKTSLSHIPKEKKEELKSIITTLLAFKEVEIIILFGSYAMGNFTEYNRYEEDGIIYEYKSDFDLLVILNKNKDAENLSFNYLMANQLNNLPCFTPISPIFEGVNFVNEQLVRGNYFFNEIKINGILLYNSKRKKLARRRKVSIEVILEQVKEYYKDWYSSANDFLFQYENAFKHEKWNNAIFQLHQATERYYHTITLVFTFYKQKTHNLGELAKIAAIHHTDIKKIFPTRTKKNQYYFHLLMDAYIDSRYKKGYKTKKEDLEILYLEVKKLKKMTKRICQYRIANFKHIKSKKATT